MGMYFVINVGQTHRCALTSLTMNSHRFPSCYGVRTAAHLLWGSLVVRIMSLSAIRSPHRTQSLSDNGNGIYNIFPL